MPVGPMRGQMMKIMFAGADTTGDGALSVAAVHKRIFDSEDANKDGKVTLEEMQTFCRGNRSCHGDVMAPQAFETNHRKHANETITCRSHERRDSYLTGRHRSHQEGFHVRHPI